jgi:uncharacterized protein
VSRIGLLCCLALTCALLARPALASEGPPTCGGANMLDELQGTEAHARIVSRAEAHENADALLWKIEQAGKPLSYLFGTVHLTDARLIAHSPTLKAALAGARRLVLELDDLSPDAFMRTFVRQRALMMFTDGRRLDQLLSEAEYAKVIRILQRTGIPGELARSFRPWVASLMLALSDCEQQRMRHGLLPLDAQLARDAQALGIGVSGLETLDQQFGALASVPEADQVELLKAGLRLYERIDDFLETTVQLYLARRLGAIWPLQLELAEQVGVPPVAFSSLEQSLVTTRNHGMRERALPHLDEGGAFIAVGALHLPGPHGLVRLLREAGYTVTALE